ncbi:MAG: hypothetical protein GEU90_05595 [Gemmatimonas sp.]|nr:hypothetical protein [Gemmatimonas sp.]
MEPRFAILLLIAALGQLLLFLLFGRYVAARWKAVGTIGFYFLITWILADSLGWWSLIWIVGHPVLSALAHVIWCRNHGIDWLTCEPRDEYLRLHPWTAADGFASWK